MRRAVIYGPLATILYVASWYTRCAFSQYWDNALLGIECLQGRTGATGTHETLPRATMSQPLLFILSSVPLSSSLSLVIMAHRHATVIFLFFMKLSQGGKRGAARNSCDTRVTWRTYKCNEKKKAGSSRMSPLRRESGVGIKSLRIPISNGDRLSSSAAPRCRLLSIARIRTHRSSGYRDHSLVRRCTNWRPTTSGSPVYLTRQRPDSTYTSDDVGFC